MYNSLQKLDLLWKKKRKNNNSNNAVMTRMAGTTNKTKNATSFKNRTESKISGFEHHPIEESNEEYLFPF